MNESRTIADVQTCATCLRPMITMLDGCCIHCGARYLQDVPKSSPCTVDKHRWAGEADAEGDTCNCGAWYRFADRIERTPTDQAT